MYEEIFVKEPCRNEDKETCILFNVRDKTAIVRTFNRAFQRRIDMHPDDIKKVFYYPNNIGDYKNEKGEYVCKEYLAEIDKKRVRIGKYRDKSAVDEPDDVLLLDDEEEDIADDIDEGTEDG